MLLEFVLAPLESALLGCGSSVRRARGVGQFAGGPTGPRDHPTILNS